MITLYITLFISWIILNYILNKYLFNTKLHYYYITYINNYKYLFIFTALFLIMNTYVVNNIFWIDTINDHIFELKLFLSKYDLRMENFDIFDITTTKSIISKNLIFFNFIKFNKNDSNNEKNNKLNNLFLNFLSILFLILIFYYFYNNYYFNNFSLFFYLISFLLAFLITSFILDRFNYSNNRIIYSL